MTTAYDHRGNLLKQQQVVGTSTTAQLIYAYDLADRITQITYPSGRIVQYLRDTKGRVNLVQTKASSSVTPWTMLADSFTYEPFAAVRAMRFGNGLSAANDWGNDSRLASRRLYRTTGGTNLSWLGYGYDSNDNITAITDLIDDTRSAYYGYDKNGRLKSALQTSSGGPAAGNGTYSYTPGTNRLSSVGGKTTGSRIFTGAAAALAASAAESLVTGRNFGDTVIANLPGIIANTVGNLVADGIASASEERAMRRAGVQRSAAAFEDKFGDTAEVAAYREAGLAAAKHPGSREARANFDRAARAMLEANSGDADVAAFLNHIDPDVGPGQLGETVVTGSRGYLLGSTLDNAGIWVGEQGNTIKQGVGQFIQDHPGVGTALTLADGAFAVVAPGKYLVGMGLDYFKDDASGYIADKMTGRNLWSAEKGQAGGSGFVLAGSLALGGLRALKGGINSIPIPGRVASRINLMTGDIKAGWTHVVDRHFNPSRSNKSQFTISQEDLRGLLQHELVVGSPVTALTEDSFRRTVEVSSPIGTLSAKRGSAETSILTIYTDRFGNLVTAHPGR